MLKKKNIAAGFAAIALTISACGGLVIDGNQGAGESQPLYAKTGPGSHSVSDAVAKYSVDRPDWPQGPSGNGLEIPEDDPFGPNEGPGSNSLND